MFHGKQLAGTAKPGGDFIENQQHAEFITQCTHGLQITGVVNAHAAGTLYHRFQNNGCNLTTVLFQHGAHCGHILFLQRALERALWGGGEVVFCQHTSEQGMHAIDRITGSHGPKGIAVIAVTQRQQLVLAGLPLAQPELQRHLDGNLNRHRTTVCQKDLLQRRRGERHQGLAELDGRLMGQTTKHDMGHAIDLVFGSLVKHRVVVAMHRRPPGRHAIHQLTTIFQRQPYPASTGHRKGGQRFGGRGVGVPEMIAVKVEVDGHDAVR